MGNKLNEDMVQQINSYPEDKSNAEISREMGIDRRTVKKYREIKESTQKQAVDLLSWNEEEMLSKKEIKKLLKMNEEEHKLSKQEKKKLELLERYSDKDVKDMLAYIANNTKREIDKVIWEPWHLRFWLIADTHIGAKECALDELHQFYEDAKKEWVECVLHAGDLVDWCNVYRWQQFEQSETGFDDQVNKVVKDYPNIWVPTYFIGWNHDESYLKNTWADICRTIDMLRDDLVYLWYYDAIIDLNWIKIQLQHWGWWNSYSKDYKLQRYIDSIVAWEEPDIFGLGHYHQAIHSLHRWIDSFMPWAFLKKNLLAKRFRFPNVIGWFIIDVTKDREWKKKLTTTFINK